MAAKEQSVHVSLQFARSRDHVLVDRVQIQQVFLNLLRNAMESMQDSPRRELTVSTAPAPEDLIAVRVSDTGSGIDPNVMEKLFQPFVTTKKQGMGVGLSICRTIIEAHGGKSVSKPIQAEALPFVLHCPAFHTEEMHT